MQQKFDYVQRGFRILVGAMSGFIGQRLNRLYKDEWWNKVLYYLDDQRDLPYGGDYEELVNSLDVANCIRIITRMWDDAFRDVLDKDCRNWLHELMGVRNSVAHIGQRDVEQRTAERALDTMLLLCGKIDQEAAAELEPLYNEVRAMADGAQAGPVILYQGVQQPETEGGHAVQGDTLLNYVGTEFVQATAQTRKITFGGKTALYPVYRVRLDQLYYNDQNDRIATWISRYESENGEGSLYGIDVGIFNDIIEEFIADSNPQALNKTQKNIALVGQREPGVTLSDGRIVDGNRRYTCLRRLQRESNEPQYFETVIMDVDMAEDRKQIKLLELSIQHGEEAKVGYDLIDYAVGTYRDVIQTGLLTVEEYAQSAGETVGEVRRRIEVAQIVTEFLAYIGLPGQYYAAREYQVYELFNEMLSPLKKLDEEGKQRLKAIAFTNAMLKAVPDQRKFIRDIKNLVSHDAYGDFFAARQEADETLHTQLQQADIRTREDVEQFAQAHQDVADQLRGDMEQSLQATRSQQLKAKPVENVKKCISMLMDVDPRLFDRLDAEEKQELKSSLEEIGQLVELFRTKID